MTAPEQVPEPPAPEAAPPDSAAVPDAAPRPPRPRLRAVGGWLLLVGIAVALDGVVGGLALVFVAAVLLAGLPPRLIGGLGVALLVAAPIAIIIEGIPTTSEISPAFVTRSLIPHHLTFAGLILVCAFALIDLGPHLRDWATAERPPQDDGPPLGTVAGAVVVGVVVVGALVACQAVLGA